MNWQGIVIHHSASPDVPANEIDRWHKQRGWDEIGYHFVIRQDGSIEPSRNFNKAGAHAIGRNTTHLGICLTGNFMKFSPTDEQIHSLVLLVKGMKSRFSIPTDKIERHHEECPGANFPWGSFISKIK